MPMQPKQKRSASGLILLVLGLAIMLPGLFLLTLLPDGCEYILSAPAFSADSAMQTQLQALREQLSEYSWTIDLRRQNVSVSSERNSGIPATLYYIPENYFTVCPETLLDGNPISGEAVDHALFHIVMNQKAADQLFPGLNPVGQELRLNHMSFEVVGLIRGHNGIGETTEALLYLPLSLSNQSEIAPETAEIYLQADGTENAAVLSGILKSWKAGGSFYSHQRLRLSALLPIILLLCTAGYFLLQRLFRSLIQVIRNRFQKTRMELQDHYPREIFIKILLRILGLLLLTGLWFGGCYLLLFFAVQPLYTFTDWVPEALADPAAIRSTIQALLTALAVPAVWQSHTVCLAVLSGSLIRWGSLLLCIGIIARRSQKSSSMP